MLRSAQQLRQLSSDAGVCLLHTAMMRGRVLFISVCSPVKSACRQGRVACGYKCQATLFQQLGQLSGNAGVCLLQAYLCIPLCVMCIFWELCCCPVQPVEGCYVVKQEYFNASSLL